MKLLLITFAQLQKQFNLPRIFFFFRYLQIRDYIRKQLKRSETEGQSTIDKCLKKPEDLWEDSLEAVHKFSNNAKHCVIQFKIIHRLHYSTVKIPSIYPNESPIYENCQSSEASLSHLCNMPQSYSCLE